MLVAMSLKCVAKTGYEMFIPCGRNARPVAFPPQRVNMLRKGNTKIACRDRGVKRIRPSCIRR